MEQKKYNKQAMTFLISQAITLFGSSLVQMAVIWYITLKTSSGSWVAAFTACSCLPQFFISFIGGVLADRYNRKILIILSDSVIALVTLFMALSFPYIISDSHLLIMLLIMTIIRSFGAGIQTPAVNSSIPLLVSKDELMKYNGINSTIQSIVQFASPLAAGAILSVMTLTSALYIDIITAVVGIFILFFVRLKTTVTNKFEPVLLDIKMGISYCISNKIILRLLIVYGVFILLCVPAGFLAQLFVSRTFGDTYWYLTAVEVVGFLGMAAGGIIMASWGGYKNRKYTLISGLAALGIFTLIMGVSRHFVLYLLFMAFYGVALSAIQTTVTTIIQENTEQGVQGRVFGLLGTTYSGLLPIGMILFGPLSDIISLRIIMIISGFVLILLPFILLRDE